MKEPTIEVTDKKSVEKGEKLSNKEVNLVTGAHNWSLKLHDILSVFIPRE